MQIIYYHLWFLEDQRPDTSELSDVIYLSHNTQKMTFVNYFLSGGQAKWTEFACNDSKIEVGLPAI